MSYDEVRSRIKGLVLNVPTPFHPETYEVDYAGLRANVERWCAAGVRTLLLTYGTSEYYALSESEIAEVTRATVQAAAGRALVVACAGRWWLGQTVEFARFCEREGADALMVVKLDAQEFLAPKNVDALVQWHEALQVRTRIPLVYHSWFEGPGTVEAIKRICALEHVVGLKQEFANCMQYIEIADAMKGRTALICGGGPPLGYWAYQFGWDAALTGVGQWNPQVELEGHAAILSGDLNAGKAYVDRIMPYRRAAARIGNHPCIKAAMDFAGYAGGPVRPPQRNLTEDEKERLRQAIRESELDG